MLPTFGSFMITTVRIESSTRGRREEDTLFTTEMKVESKE